MAGWILTLDSEDTLYQFYNKLLAMAGLFFNCVSNKHIYFHFHSSTILC